MQFAAYDPPSSAGPAVPSPEQIEAEQRREREQAEPVFPLLRQVVPGAFESGAPFLGLYFSAHWCGPCKVFTPLLAQFYERNRAQLEVAFVSFDRTPAQFEEYSATMPWHKIPFEQRDAVEEIAEALKVGGIPCLVVLHPESKRVISYNARGDVQQYLDNGSHLVQLWKTRFGIEDAPAQPPTPDS